MRKDVLTSYVLCDVCGCPHGNESSFEIDGREWDVCKECAGNLSGVLGFLSVDVGMQIKYKHIPAPERIEPNLYDWWQERWGKR